MAWCLKLWTEQYLHSQTQPSGTVILILMMASAGSLSFLSPWYAQLLGHLLARNYVALTAQVLISPGAWGVRILYCSKPMKHNRRTILGSIFQPTVQPSRRGWMNGAAPSWPCNLWLGGGASSLAVPIRMAIAGITVLVSWRPGYLWWCRRLTASGRRLWKFCSVLHLSKDQLISVDASEYIL